MATRDFLTLTPNRRYTWDEVITITKYRNRNVTGTPINWVYAGTNIPVIIACSNV